jgi:hypothetical protein
VAVSAQIFHHLTWAKGALAYTFQRFYPLRLRYFQIKPWVSTPFWILQENGFVHLAQTLFWKQELSFTRLACTHFAIKTTSGYDAMHMGMKIELLSPGV